MGKSKAKQKSMRRIASMGTHLEARTHSKYTQRPDALMRKDEAICDWCGGRANTRMPHNGEWICIKCKISTIKD